MFTKLKVLSAISLLYASSAMADLAGAKGTLNNVDSAVNDTVTKAMRLFEENHGTAMGSSFSNLASTVTEPGITNPYLQVLRITTDYKVEIKFASGAKSAINPVRC